MKDAQAEAAPAVDSGKEKENIILAGNTILKCPFFSFSLVPDRNFSRRFYESSRSIFKY
jgi:hypothetical protein